jgi:hypothetical protein
LDGGNLDRCRQLPQRGDNEFSSGQKAAASLDVRGKKGEQNAWSGLSMDNNLACIFTKQRNIHDPACVITNVVDEGRRRHGTNSIASVDCAVSRAARRSCEAKLVRLKAKKAEIGKPASRNASAAY